MAAMLRRHLLSLLLLLLPSAAPAAERRVDLSSFQKLRVEGGFVVTLTTAPSPRGTLSGDAEALRQVETRIADGTLVVRRVAAGEPSRRTATTPLTLTLAAPPLSAITVIGGAQVSAQALRGAAMAVTITGGGDVRVDRVEGDQLNAMLLGTARLSIAGGRVGKARLAGNGAIALAAEGLEAGDLSVTLDGPGEIQARARYSATVTNGGVGQVTVAGTPKCRIMPGSGPVRCGAR